MSETYYERDPGGPARSATLMDLLAYLLDPFCGVRKPFCWRLARLAGVTFPTTRPGLSPDVIIAEMSSHADRLAVLFAISTADVDASIGVAHLVTQHLLMGGCTKQECHHRHRDRQRA